MIFGRQLADIGTDDIQELVDLKTPEGRHLDYKESLPGGTDSEKKAFLADVSALANSAGGDIIYGVREERDAAAKTTGLPKAVVGLSSANLDEARRRLTSIIESGLDPALVPKTEMVAFTVEEQDVLVVRVPKSFTGPHMIRESGRFYARHNSQNVQMDAAMVRTAFMSSESWAKKVVRFRDERIAGFRAGRFPCTVSEARIVAMHLVPFSAFVPDIRLDIAGIKPLEVAPVLDSHGWSHRYNLDGVCVFTGNGNHPSYGWAQYFRSGAVEATWCFSGDRSHLHLIEDHIIYAVEAFPTLS